MGLKEVDGANVRVVPWSGKGIGDAVVSVLIAPPEPPRPDAFRPWSDAAVDEGLRVLHRDLEMASSS
jgi:hypothetical protein